MAQHGKAWHSVAKHVTAWQSMVKHVTAWQSMVKHGTAWHSMVKHGTAWQCRALDGQSWPCGSGQPLMAMPTMGTAQGGPPCPHRGDWNGTRGSLGHPTPRLPPWWGCPRRVLSILIPVRDPGRYGNRFPVFLPPATAPGEGVAGPPSPPRAAATAAPAAPRDRHAPPAPAPTQPAPAGGTRSSGWGGEGGYHTGPGTPYRAGEGGHGARAPSVPRGARHVCHTRPISSMGQPHPGTVGTQAAAGWARAVPLVLVPCRAMLCHAVPCCAMPCHAVPCRAVPCRARPRAVWRGLQLRAAENPPAERVKIAAGFGETAFAASSPLQRAPTGSGRSDGGAGHGHRGDKRTLGTGHHGARVPWGHGAKGTRCHGDRASWGQEDTETPFRKGELAKSPKVAAGSGCAGVGAVAVPTRSRSRRGGGAGMGGLVPPRAGQRLRQLKACKIPKGGGGERLCRCWRGGGANPVTVPARWRCRCGGRNREQLQNGGRGGWCPPEPGSVARPCPRQLCAFKRGAARLSRISRSAY
ncbi:PREDICTED: translation initiation factor IF-2-like [Calidris pugnax]|uniref:translation initiation factor IF-2-like n=1 Tax=Calidris pugnax TaxID=198806 RepID=UPI00071D643B|nr:PREDICTED: translation initiation factor IF-2-like [Calidris pugnax]